jgi:uncharacterized membrane protein YoaK (UPF0700 family)
MVLLRLENKYFSKSFVTSVWLLMAFQAGYVNVGAFLTSGNFVSHVTGTSSQIGIGVANLNLSVLATFLTILLAFIAGAAFSGHYIGRHVDEGKDPRYTFVLSVKSFFFGMILLLSLGAFSFEAGITTLLIVFCLSFCCGVQNSTCALSTNGFLKPTHMTGLSTDIGINLTKIFALSSSSNEYKEERNKNFLRISILFSFIAGGCISGLVFSQSGAYGFLFPFLSSMAFLAMSVSRDFIRLGENSFVFKTARNSLYVNFITTVSIGVNTVL